MKQTRKEYVISIMARDRVGIIADVSGAISYMGGDLADMRQQVLRGYFTMILHASFPADTDEATILDKLSRLDDPEFGSLAVQLQEVRTVPVDETAPSLENSYVLTAEGEDRIGFVATVSKFCADNEINILDLSTTVAEDRYIMILFVDLSRCASIDELRRRLDHFAQETDLNMVLQHYDIFKATNEIKIFFSRSPGDE
ncbi:glycine cleavage system protein R [Desulfolithobacter sp.]